MKLNKLENIKKFLAAHFELQVIPSITKHLIKQSGTNNYYSLIENIQYLEDLGETNKNDLIVCYPLLNNFTNLNQSLAKVYNSLRWGGIFVNRVEILEQRRRRIASRCNRFTYRIINLYEFLFKRVLKKLKGFRFLYKKLNIIRHHLLSQCEALGRLRYCGFEILVAKKTDKYLYFVTQKNSKPSDGKPYDGVFIKIPKVGRNGRTIYCYKLRTMHAYANYIHDYVLRNSQLDNNGKVMNDFRVPRWGRFLRKTWLDELPQLYNILKGDISFIGLRHLSREFLSLYPKDWRTIRVKFKPGFIPPYYADCPQSFAEIIESERRYYERKRRYPVSTDIVYFIRVVVSFLSGKARTG